MRTVTRLSIVSAAAAAFLSSPLPSATPEVPLYQRFLSPASPQEVVAARKVDRVAWVDYAEGKRNAYTAMAPLFVPVKLTNFTKDDGIMMSAVKISDDGSTVIFLRGEQLNRDGWAPNPSADPDGPEHAIWAARTSGTGGAWRVAKDVNNPELAPDGSAILFVKEGQIYRAKLSPVKPATEQDRGEKAFITEWGVQSSPKYSPDGRKIAFVSTRTDHSFIVVYDVATRTVKYISPSVDFDTMPMWLPDSKHLVFMRRPGLPFGQQAQQGTGGIGLPPGPAAAAVPGAAAVAAPGAAATAAPGAAAAARGGRGNGGGGRGNGRGNGGGGTQAAAGTTPVVNNSPGLMTATFKGGYTLSFYKADVITGDAQEIWHNQPNDAQVSNFGNNAHLEGDYLVYPFLANGGRGGRGGGGRGNAAAPAAEVQPATPAAPATPPAPVDEWDRYFSLNIMDASARPVLLTTTDGLIEDQTSIGFSGDSKTFYYCTNAKDIERRHIWAVPVSGGTPVQVTAGDGVETYPAPLPSSKYIATLSANWNLPQSLGVWKMGADAGATPAQKIVFPTSRPGFPMDLHVKPEIVITKAADGVEVHNQLFLPKDLKPGERRPAIVFVHGGPQRQMMPAYHYMQFYHWAYGINEWLANQGYVVMSINYRLGIGYGRTFRQAQNTGANGEAEYQDVLAGGKYLQSRPDVDPNRVGIWGLSYGGLLTSQALARNSDIFKAGVDLAGVHLFGSSLDPESVSYKSSTIGNIDGWKSPVLLIQGDDDRNVAFQQMTGLIQLLRQRDVYYELIVFPDDVHESLLHSRWLYAFGRMETFLHKFLWDLPATPTSAANQR
jgi:dipeptidyl aminopeptidase/acylaminoacyl peptidase